MQHIPIELGEIAEGNIFRDENGVEHYPLFTPCFLEPSAESDLQPTDELNRRMRELSDSL